MRIPMLLVRQSLRPDDATPAPVLRWLQEATATPDLGAPLERLRQLQLWRDTTNTVDVVPHALPGVTLALQVRRLLLHRVGRNTHVKYHTTVNHTTLRP